MAEEIKTTGVYSGRDIINEHVLNDKQVPSTRAVICHFITYSIPLQILK
jgi:hypothetical protein